MLDHPKYSDAAILIALTWGGSPAYVLGATGHLNAAQDHTDWVHACALLGALGLISPGDPLPSPTLEGKAMVGRYCPSGAPPRLAAMKLEEALATLLVAAKPVSPPERRVIDDAIAEWEKLHKRWEEEHARKKLIPSERDASILVSLHLGLDTRTDETESDNERPRPSAADWQHVVQAFGRRGLIERNGETLRPTAKGVALIEACRNEAEGDRDLLRRIVIQAEVLPMGYPATKLPYSTLEKVYRGPFWPWLLAEEI